MISEEEKLYLYWLGQSVWSGQGGVVEIGPWLGGSTVCLAAGMQASRHDSHKRLCVFDNFVWREFMAARAPLPIQVGDSFHSFFLRNVRDYQHTIESYVRALPDEVIHGDHEASNKRFHEVDKIPTFETFSQTVEILFIDGAKSWRGMRHLLNVLNDHFIPGKSYLICQDYKYWGTYWVPIMMIRLEKYLKPVHNILGGTTVGFRLESEIPHSVLSNFEDHVAEMPTKESLQAIERASSRLAEEDCDDLGSANVLLCKVSFLAHQGRVGMAVEEFKKIQKSWPPSLNMLQLERAREYLSNQSSCEIRRSKKLVLSLLIRSAWNKIKHCARPTM